MEKKTVAATLYCGLPEELEPDILIHAYTEFIDVIGEEVNYEGFVNGFAYAVSLIHACAQEVADGEGDCDLKA